MTKPTVMVVPSDTWCHDNGYMVTTGTATYPDYRNAIIGNSNLLDVISKINILMADRGFPLENLETAIKNLNTENVERALYTAKDGSNIRLSALDELYRAAQADIILQLTWTVNTIGPKSSITFNLQAIDSYTTKQVAGAQGTGRASFSSDIPTMLEEAVVSHIDNFCSRLLQYFIDMKERGREISIDIYLAESADFDFSTEYGDHELTEVITSAIAESAMNRNFSMAPSTDTFLQYKSVRIPVTDGNGMPLDAYGYGRRLARTLSKAYDLDVKAIAKGLGKTVLIIGSY